MSEKKFRWGIIGTGSIAHKFAVGLKHADGSSLAAVGSRTKANADLFADTYGVAKRYDSYEAVAADPDIDAIYIATPHPQHRENSLLCISHGKAVLCEKPFTVNEEEAIQVVAAARAKGVFIMDAMWTRLFPLMQTVRDHVADKTIGDLRLLQADFGFRGGWDPNGRHLNRDLAGGALLDVGVYPIALASMLFGAPSGVTGLADIGKSGVDEQSAMVLSHPGGELAVLCCAVRTNTPHEAILNGTSGRIRIHSPWWIPQRMTLSVDGKPDKEIHVRVVGNGYNYEADEVRRRVLAGETESPLLPLSETLEIMRTMDTLRRQWGLAYPFEG